MTRLARLALLVSLGLNLGLGWTVLHALRREPVRSSAAAGAWRGRPAPEDSAGWSRMMHRRTDRLASILDLDPAAAEALQQLQEAVVPQIRARREMVDAARRHLREVASEDTFAPDETRRAAGQWRRGQAQLDSLTQDLLLQELALMSSPQRVRYLELLPLDLRPGDGPGRGQGRSGPRRHHN